jgi:hypothetical protein
VPAQAPAAAPAPAPATTASPPAATAATAKPGRNAQTAPTIAIPTPITHAIFKAVAYFCNFIPCSIVLFDSSIRIFINLLYSSILSETISNYDLIFSTKVRASSNCSLLLGSYLFIKAFSLSVCLDMVFIALSLSFCKIWTNSRSYFPLPVRSSISLISSFSLILHSL